jgi:MATE family multidrug resistance protein
MRVVMVSSAVLVFVPVWYLTRPLGNHGLWLAFSLFMLARGLGMHWWFRAMISKGPLAAGRACWA